MHSLDFRIVIIKKGEIGEAMSSKVILMMPKNQELSKGSSKVMQSYPARALARRLQVDWARDPRKGPRVLMSLRVDFEPMG